MAVVCLVVVIAACSLFASCTMQNSSRDQSFHMENMNLYEVPSAVLGRHPGVTSLHLEDTDLYEVPKQILGKHPGISSLFLQYNKITRIRKTDFPPNATQHLVYINIRGNYIKHIEEDAFSQMPNLHVVLRIPNRNGQWSEDHLANANEPTDLNQNSLTEVPKLKAPKIRELLLRHNKIKSIDYDAMQHYKNVEHLDLKHNDISFISGGTFLENKKLVFMVLSGNPLREIEETGLVGPTDLQFLYLDNTQLTTLPSKGVASITTLDIRGTPNLISLPDPGKFEELSEISVEYSMHCCAFRAVRMQPNFKNTRTCPDVLPQAAPAVPQRRRKRYAANYTGKIPDMENGLDDIFQEIIDSFKNDAPEPKNESDKCRDLIRLEQERADNQIKCSPEPDEFNPCEDVMGTHVLRAFSWLISIFAVFGNIFQLVILFSSRQVLSVYKLLMYNLGFSNLLMGIYLMILCCVDSYSYGKYYNFAQSWQYNGGCKTMGFIALFATQLSVCSLVLITIERFLLIIYALQVQNQMKLKHAMIGVAVSWFYSFLVALLPLTDTIGSYTKVAICLPMSMKTMESESYVVWLLLSYIVAFLLIVFCYIRMYINISDVRPGNSNATIDIQVAKRMSMIIFSNFLCWLPISIAGIMAMYSKIEFNVGVGKFLLVFIFPLNACTNPFLYAIFTKVFRGDTLALLSSCGLFKAAETEHQRNEDQRKNPQTALQSLMRIQDSIDMFRTSYNIRETNVETPLDHENVDTLAVMVRSNYQDARITKIRKLQNASEMYTPRRNDEHIVVRDHVVAKDTNTKIGPEAEIKQCRDPRFRSDTCSTGVSCSMGAETDEEFAKMIGSIQRAECNILLE